MAGEQVGLERRPAERRARAHDGRSDSNSTRPSVVVSARVREAVAGPDVARVVRRRADRARSLTRSGSRETVEQRGLGGIDLLARGVERRTTRARSTSGISIRRPERGGHSSLNVLLVIAVGVEIAGERPRRHALPDFCRTSPRSRASPSGGAPELLRELAPRRGERILVGVVLALGDRPRPGVAPRPQRAARVDEQHL